jgi:hypothetical protein
MFSGEVTNNNFIVFGLTRSGLKPTIYHTWGEHANHYTTDTVAFFWLITIKTICFLRWQVMANKTSWVQVWLQNCPIRTLYFWHFNWMFWSMNRKLMLKFNDCKTDLVQANIKYMMYPLHNVVNMLLVTWM